MFKTILIKSVRFYRYFLSPLKPASCRYYPTCSSYALLQLKANNILFALFFTSLRLLRCNPFFRGGIDYPVVFKRLCVREFEKRKVLKYFYVPCKKSYKSYYFKPQKQGFFDNKYFLIKKL